MRTSIMCLLCAWASLQIAAAGELPELGLVDVDRRIERAYPTMTDYQKNLVRSHVRSYKDAVWYGRFDPFAVQFGVAGLGVALVGFGAAVAGAPALALVGAVVGGAMMGTAASGIIATAIDGILNAQDTRRRELTRLNELLDRHARGERLDWPEHGARTGTGTGGGYPITGTGTGYSPRATNPGTRSGRVHLLGVPGAGMN